MKRRIILFIIIFISIPFYSQTEAINDSLQYGALKVFFDCHFCDEDHIRREVPYVNYVRDTKEAQVHVLVTRETTGSDGRAYTFTFIGQKEFQNLNDTLVYTQMPDDTEETIREGQIRTLKMGLMRYIARTPMVSQIEINYSGHPSDEPVEDKWKSWVFITSISTDFDGEKSNTDISFIGSLAVQKVTPVWKIDFLYYSRFDEEKYITEEEGTIYGTNLSHSVNLLAVKSINDHWSYGGTTNIASSLYRNYKLTYGIFPGIEYDLFPYSQSTRRQLRLMYSSGFRFNNYNDTTIFNKTRESLWGQQFDVAFEVTQKWGSIETSLNWLNYIHDWSKNNLSLYSEISLRITKGLELDIDLGLSLVHDQINLQKESVSTEDILLQIKELETNYQYEFDIGISYTFGAIYNNVVNPRFGNGGSHYYY